MENLYELLNCRETASWTEIKRAYQSLALQYHPDKHEGSSSTSNDRKGAETKQMLAEKFVKINKAWNILNDPKLRKEYDIRWKQRCLAQDWPIQEEVNFSAFELDGHAGNGPCTEDSNMYTYHCRCGGEFSLTKTDVTLKFDIICCNTCSLAVKVIYNETFS